MLPLNIIASGPTSSTPSIRPSSRTSRLSAPAQRRATREADLEKSRAHGLHVKSRSASGSTGDREMLRRPAYFLLIAGLLFYTPLLFAVAVAADNPVLAAQTPQVLNTSRMPGLRESLEQITRLLDGG